MIIFACIAPHAPILLPKVGLKEDKLQIKKTLKALELLKKRFKEKNPSKIIISAPHLNWGFEVPLYFLAQNFREKIETFFIGIDSPIFYFKQGQELYKSNIKNQKDPIALISSGDLSHRLKEEGPYGFHSEGPKFDQKLIESLKKKDLETIFKLDELYPQAGECGLRSFCFLLGILEASKIKWNPEILSYEGPFGVGYLVVNFKLN